MSNIQKAIEFASIVHEGQTRSDGTPYFNHVKRVGELVREYTDDDDMITAAYLHDTVEDTFVTLELLEADFNSKVAQVVQSLTNNSEELNALGKTRYMMKKMVTLDPDVLLIKLCDRLDNVSDLKTAKSVTWAKKYANQTFAMLQVLNARINIDLNQKHFNLAARIADKLNEFEHSL